jgi:hypothetical protein
MSVLSLVLDAFAYSSESSGGGGEFVFPLGPKSCKAVAYSVYYLGVCMFSWMSVKARERRDLKGIISLPFEC